MFQTVCDIDGKPIHRGDPVLGVYVKGSAGEAIVTEHFCSEHSVDAGHRVEALVVAGGFATLNCQIHPA